MSFRRKGVKALTWVERPIGGGVATTSRQLLVRRARRGYRINRRIGGLMRRKGELKSVDTTINSAADTTGGLLLVNGIARGDDINERIGRRVIMKSIQVGLTVRGTAGTGIDQWHRYVLVYDKQANGAALTYLQVFAAADMNGMRNLENRERFMVLMDKKIHLNASGEPESHRQVSAFRRINLPITFNNGDAGTIADITTGSLYLIVYGNIAAGATAGSAYGFVRVRYEDS